MSQTHTFPKRKSSEPHLVDLTHPQFIQVIAVDSDYSRPSSSITIAHTDTGYLQAPLQDHTIHATRPAGATLPDGLSITSRR